MDFPRGQQQYPLSICFPTDCISGFVLKGFWVLYPSTSNLSICYTWNTFVMHKINNCYTNVATTLVKWFEGNTAYQVNDKGELSSAKLVLQVSSDIPTWSTVTFSSVVKRQKSWKSGECSIWELFQTKVQKGHFVIRTWCTLYSLPVLPSVSPRVQKPCLLLGSQGREFSYTVAIKTTVSQQVSDPSLQSTKIEQRRQ